MPRHCFAFCVCLIMIGFALPSHAQQATVQCAYNFTSGSKNTSLTFCVTVNGNVPDLEFPPGNGDIVTEGYGICNESPAVNYTDYGGSDTGNWNQATLVSQTSSLVKIARTTADGNWTLTQTISKVASPPSVKIVMALTNNQPADHVVYLVRYGGVAPGGILPAAYMNTKNSGIAWSKYGKGPTHERSGAMLQVVGTPPLPFWHGYTQTVQDGPNACAFAFNAAGGDYYEGFGSIELAFAGTVRAHQTKTVTVAYQPM